MTFAIALTAAILSAASLILHVIAPKTKSTLDDRAVKVIDSAIDKLKFVHETVRDEEDGWRLELMRGGD